MIFFPDLPDYLLGACRLRGAPVPVVDLARLLCDTPRPPRRLVALSLPETGRRCALAVDAVIGVRALDERALTAMPSLLTSARTDAVARLGEHDGELLLVLDAARLVPADAWTRFGLPGEAS